jgi:hypothetical protein
VRTPAAASMIAAARPLGPDPTTTASTLNAVTAPVGIR